MRARAWTATLASIAAALVGTCGGGPSSVPSPSPAEPGWGVPQRLAPETTALLPAVAVDASGNALAMWTDLTHARACHFTPSSGWGAAESVDATEEQPKAAFDGQGRAIALWTTGPVRVRGLSTARYEPGIGWGPIVPLVPPSLSSWPFLGGDLFVRADGSAAVVWRQMVGGQHRMWARRFDPLAGWAPPELAGEGHGNASAARISGDGEGALIVVWHSSDGATADVRTVRFEPGSGWGTVQVLHSSPGRGDQSHPPELAVSSDGSAFLVWPAMSAGEASPLWAARYSRASGWEAPQSITVAGVRRAVLPFVAADGSGGAIAVWNQDDGNNLQIWSNRYSLGRGWLAAGRLDSLAPTDVVPNVENARVAGDARGNGFAVWTQLTQSSPLALYRTYAARFRLDGGWSAGQPIDSDNATGPGEIAVDAAGNAIAVWTRGPYPESQVWANRYSVTSAR